MTIGLDTKQGNVDNNASADTPRGAYNSQGNELQLSKREQIMKARDEATIKCALKGGISIIEKSTLPNEGNILSIAEGESICKYLKQLNEKIDSYNDPSKLSTSIQDAYNRLELIKKAGEAFMLPQQIYIGMQLTKLKLLTKIEKIAEQLSLPPRTCYHYIIAANAVPYITRDCVYELGIMIVAGLGDYLKKETCDIKSDRDFDEKIIGLFEPRLDPNSEDFEKLYKRRVQFYYYKYIFFVGFNIDESLFKSLYDSKFEWTYRHAKIIKDYGSAPVEKGKKDRKIVNPEVVNEAMKILIDKPKIKITEQSFQAEESTNHSVPQSEVIDQTALEEPQQAQSFSETCKNYTNSLNNFIANITCEENSLSNEDKKILLQFKEVLNKCEAAISTILPSLDDNS